MRSEGLESWMEACPCTTTLPRHEGAPHVKGLFNASMGLVFVRCRVILCALESNIIYQIDLGTYREDCLSSYMRSGVVL